MKVTVQQPERPQIRAGDVPYGGLYTTLRGEHYIRIDPYCTIMDDNTTHIHGVALSTGQIWNTPINNLVIPVDGEVLIKGDKR
jgi:hypothetical protein